MKNLLLGLVLLAGCSTPGYVKADGIEGVTRPVCARHDAYVKADPKLHDAAGNLTPEGQTALDSSALLLQAIDEAIKAAKKNSATADANTTRK